MRKWSSQVLILAALLALGLWGWGLLFPSPEKVIRRRLIELAKLASFGSNEAPAAKLLNAQKLATFFTPDTEVALDVPGHRETFSGRDELATRALGARQMLSALNVKFVGVIVNVAPGTQSAVVNLTGEAKIPGESDLLVQELKLAFKRDGRNWLISRVETVKILR